MADVGGSSSFNIRGRGRAAAPAGALSFGVSDRSDQWRAIQADLRSRLIVAPLDPLPRFVAGVDCAFTRDKKEVLSAAVVYDREAREIIEIQTARRPVEVPYLPGYLSFREGPAVLEAVGRLKEPFGAICFDGQGYAHPRRCGLAVHMGVTLDVPSVGVAKSRLTGTFAEPGNEPGDASPLTDGGETIGLVLRTRENVRPLFISVGHRVDLDSARRLVMACRTKYRLPEPTRQADAAVGRLKRSL